jgi:hypothetical protein
VRDLGAVTELHIKTQYRTYIIRGAAADVHANWVPRLAALLPRF